jgi:hypothetical protein
VERLAFGCDDNKCAVCCSALGPLLVKITYEVGEARLSIEIWGHSNPFAFERIILSGCCGLAHIGHIVWIEITLFERDLGNCSDFSRKSGEEKSTHFRCREVVKGPIRQVVDSHCQWGLADWYSQHPTNLCHPECCPQLSRRVLD